MNVAVTANALSVTLASTTTMSSSISCVPKQVSFCSSNYSHPRSIEFSFQCMQCTVYHTTDCNCTQMCVEVHENHNNIILEQDIFYGFDHGL